MFSRFDTEMVEDWFKHPYHILPRREGEWYLIVPKMFDLNVGHMIDSTKSHNVFIVNKFAQYLGAIPAEFEKVFKFKPTMPLRVYDGMLLTGVEYQDAAWERYRGFLQNRQGSDRIRIKTGSQFKLVASLIDDGILPFIPTPVDASHLIPGVWHLEKIEKDEDRQNVEMRLGMDFFKDAVQKFLDTGAVGIFWAMGVGKTLFSLELLSRVRADDLPNLIIAGKYTTLKDQWKNNLELITPAAPVEIINYQGLKSIRGKRYGLKIIDEGQNMPADTFAESAFDNSLYRAVLSATPVREDGRTDYIFALGGFPIGLDWRVLIELGLIKAPDIILFLCENYGQKKSKLAELLMEPKKTLIYSFGKDIGHDLSKSFDIPFVYGDTPTKDRLAIIKSSQVTVVSSVAKEGISIRDLERTITYNFLFGSRQEEEQFFGRVLHGEHEGQHIMMMTDEEYDRYGKRLFGIQEHGFKIRRERIGGGGRMVSSPRPVKRRAHSIPNPVTTGLPAQFQAPKQNGPPIDESKYPFLDERDDYDEKMVLSVLSSGYAREKGGLTLGEIHVILDHNHIKYKNWRSARGIVEQLYEKRVLAGSRAGTKRRYFLKEEVRS
jgi:DNA excision repair protein ERCC-3